MCLGLLFPQRPSTKQRLGRYLWNPWLLGAGKRSRVSELGDAAGGPEGPHSWEAQNIQSTVKTWEMVGQGGAK